MTKDNLGILPAQLAIRVAPRGRHIVIVLTGRLDRSVINAARFARSIRATEVRALHAAADPDVAHDLMEEWIHFGYLVGIPLDLDECIDRNIIRSVRAYVDSLKRPDTEITLVLPRREYPHVHRLLHDRTSRAIARAMAGEPHVEVIAIPYYVHQPRHAALRPAA